MTKNRAGNKARKYQRSSSNNNMTEQPQKPAAQVKPSPGNIITKYGITQAQLDYEVLSKYPVACVFIRDYVAGESVTQAEAVIIIRNGLAQPTYNYCSRKHVIAFLSTIGAPYMLETGSVIERAAADAALLPYEIKK